MIKNYPRILKKPGRHPRNLGFHPKKSGSFWGAPQDSEKNPKNLGQPQEFGAFYAVANLGMAKI